METSTTDTGKPELARVWEHIKQLAEGVSHSSPAKEKRLLDLPIDILCFGRAGVGKTTLLEAITGRDLGSTPRLDHGTTKLTSVEIHEPVRLTGGETASLHLRFWDSKGIDDWQAEDVPLMLQTLEKEKAFPLCVFYCATGHGRVDKNIVEAILFAFHTKSVVLFWVVTDMYSMQDEQLTAQIEEGKEVMSRISRAGQFTEPFDRAYNFGDKCFLVAVNSKVWTNSNLGVTRGPKNIDNLMRLCVTQLDSEGVILYFLATLRNRDFWQQAGDDLADILSLLKRYQIDVTSLLAQAWEKTREGLRQLFQFAPTVLQLLGFVL